MRLNTISTLFKNRGADALYNHIAFWIVIFFLIRLIGISNPPLEFSHSWRQTTGTMVARNFFETNPNILYPRVDETNGGTGIIGMEFPLLNYSVYLVSLVFGYTHWYGRLINLIISSIGVWYFFKILQEFIDSKLAFPATVLLLASLWFSFSRKTMPDTFSFSLSIISLYYGLTYLSRGEIRNLALFAIFFELGVLSKIPAIMFPIFLVIPLFGGNAPLARKFYLSIVGIVFMVPIMVWYYYWCPYLSQTYGSWYNGGQNLLQGFREVIAHPHWAAYHFYHDAMRTAGFIAFFCGIVLITKKREHLLITILGLSIVLFLLFVFKSGHFFLANDYYILLYVPIMCLMASYAINCIGHKGLRTAVLFLIIGEGVLTQCADLMIPDQEAYKISVEKVADSFSHPTDLVAVNGGVNPQLLYLSHRKGWTISSEQMHEADFINSLARKGCRYLIADLNLLSDSLPYPVIYSGQHFRAFKIDAHD